MEALYSLYTENLDIFQEDAYKVTSTNKNIRDLDQLFAVHLNKTAPQIESHSLMRINRMTPARILRKLLPKPPGLPNNAGIGVERFLAVDTGASQTYPLPTTDCSNMFIYLAKASRTIVLRPTNECQMECRLLSIHVEENSFCKCEFGDVFSGILCITF